MPSVVHHKDTVCLQGGQLGGGDINRERKERQEVELGKQGTAWTEDMGEAAFNFIYFYVLSLYNTD